MLDSAPVLFWSRLAIRILAASSIAHTFADAALTATPFRRPAGAAGASSRLSAAGALGSHAWTTHVLIFDVSEVRHV